MSFKDLQDSEEQDLFTEGGFCFAARGDFNRDGRADLAFAGKFRPDRGRPEQVFLAIVTFSGKTLSRQFLAIIDVESAFLLVLPNNRDGVDGLLISYAIASDWCEVLCWNGKKYMAVPCDGD